MVRKPNRLRSASSNRPVARRQLAGRDVDLLVLAGCSCLMTLLHHPVAEALRSHATVGSVQPMPAQTQRTGAVTLHLSLAMPPERPTLQGEEEEEV